MLPTPTIQPSLKNGEWGEEIIAEVVRGEGHNRIAIYGGRIGQPGGIIVDALRRKEQAGISGENIWYNGQY
jgi:hypothetical protein